MLLSGASTVYTQQLLSWWLHLSFHWTLHLTIISDHMSTPKIVQYIIQIIFRHLQLFVRSFSQDIGQNLLIFGAGACATIPCIWQTRLFIVWKALLFHLDIPYLLQIDTFGKWLRCLTNVCYVKLKKIRYLDKLR